MDDDGWNSGIKNLPHRSGTKRTNDKKKRCLDRGSNTGPLDLQSNALPTELSKQLYGEVVRTLVQEQVHFDLWTTQRPTCFFFSTIPFTSHPWWYSVVVSISGCDPLDPGSNPGTAITFLWWFGVRKLYPESFLCVSSSLTWVYSILLSDQCKYMDVDHPHCRDVRGCKSQSTPSSIQRSLGSTKETKKVLHSVGLEPTPTKLTTT